MFWDINNLSTVKYSIRKRASLKRYGVVNRFKRGGSRKIIKKTQSTSLLRVIHLNFLFNSFSNTPPVSTLLNLIGVNVQKFCEEMNKEFVGLFHLNVLVKFRVLVFKNLTFNYTINSNISFLVKNLLINESNPSIIYLNYVTDRSILSMDRLMNSSLLTKIFTSSNFIQLGYLVYFLNFSIFKFNCFKTNLVSFFNFSYLNCHFESIVRNNYSILKSFNLKSLKIVVI